MSDPHMKEPSRYFRRRPMLDPLAPEGPLEPSVSQAHLVRAHYEICTALMVLRSNVALVRVELRETAPAEVRVAVQTHLSELDLAVDRLRRLAAEMRGWHSDAAHAPR